MKLHHRIILFGMLIVLWACAPKPAVSLKPEPVKPADELFLNAELQFQSKSYDEALRLYHDYLLRYPKASLAPAALMKIGVINSIVGRYQDARQAYQRLISEYPDSSFSEDAVFEILYTYYKERKFQEVLTRASIALENAGSLNLIVRIYSLIGDTYLALGYALDAVQYYAEAHEKASELEQDALNLKLKEAIAQLDSDDVAILLDSSEERLPMDYLLFQLGLNMAMEERYGEALSALEKFLEKYPENENATLAEGLIEEIKKNVLFRRYTLGCLLPLSGPYQTFGHRALKGIELALDQFSFQSGNPSINIVVKDTGGDPDKTRQAVQELNAEKVAAIIGPIVSAEIAAQEAQALGIPIITITQKDNVTEIGDNVFRNFITPKMQVQAIADYVVGSLGLHRFAILYPDENYGNTFMNLFWDQLIEKGGSVVGVEAYNPEHTDFADPIKKLVGLYYEMPEDLKAAMQIDFERENGDQFIQPEDPNRSSDQPNEKGTQAGEEDKKPEPIVDFEVIFIPDAPKKAGLIVPQLAYYDVNDVLLIGTNLWHSDSLIQMAEQYVQGAIIPDGFFSGSQSPPVKHFIKKFEETYQEQPGFIEAVMYDTAMMLLNVVSNPELRFRNELRDELLNLSEFQGVTGATRFDENGDALKKLYLLTIKGKKFIEIE